MLDWGLYRDCFSTPEMRAIWSESATLSAWIRVEQTLAQSQAAFGVIPQAAADRLAALDPAMIDRDTLRDDMALTGRPIVGLVRQLRKLVGPDHADHVHYLSTTQDILDTALTLQMRAALPLVHAGLKAAADHLGAHSRAHPDLRMIGRTNGQHALPIRLADKFDLWRAELMRRDQALQAAGARALFVQIGGPMGDLSGYAGDIGVKVRGECARRLGLGVAEPHWQSSRDGLAEVVTALGLVCASLCKIAHNINLLCSSDIAELAEFHSPGRGASSSMGHKRNPRASEFGEALGRMGRQRSEQIGELTLHQHERSGGVWIAEWVLVPEVFQLASGALMWGERLLSGLVIDADAMAAAIVRANNEAARTG